jgi:hypothetical protein
MGERQAPSTSPVYLELGTKKVFACSVDWPGLCRAAKSEELALDALRNYELRYRLIAERAGYPFALGELTVVERTPGNATTDFGVPGAVPARDAVPVTAVEAARAAALMRAAWDELADYAAVAPAELRKGPRGGGRDRDAMLAHVVDAERAYARKIGVRHPPFNPTDRDSLAALRAEVLDVLGRPHDGAPLVDRGWPARYAARRIVWHVLDHLWEMQDRSS